MSPRRCLPPQAHNIWCHLFPTPPHPSPPHISTSPPCLPPPKRMLIHVNAVSPFSFLSLHPHPFNYDVLPTSFTPPPHSQPVAVIATPPPPMYRTNIYILATQLLFFLQQLRHPLPPTLYLFFQLPFAMSVLCVFFFSRPFLSPCHFFFNINSKTLRQQCAALLQSAWDAE